MNKPHPTIKRLYLDLDRTLYMTDEAYRLIARACHELWPNEIASAQRLLDDIPRFYSSDNPHVLRTNEFYKQVASYGVDLTKDGNEGRLRDKLSKYDLLFPDARILLDFLDDQQEIETKIITFGEVDFQRFKLSLIPRLARYPVIITMDEKGEYLREKETAAPSLLVDDKANLGLPTWCEGILLDRNDSHPDFKEGVVVDSLAKIRQLLVA